MNPCVKCPPSGRSSPIIRLCGSHRAVYTAKLAGDPEYGCTLTPHSSGLNLNAANARFWHRISISSITSLPP